MKLLYVFKTKFEIGVLAGLLLLPLAATASTTATWNSAGDGMWEDASKWTGGAPSNDTSIVNIKNAGSKTVTIGAATPAANLTITNLLVEAPSGATNTLILSGNSNPLRLQMTSAFGYAFGFTAGNIGSLVLDQGTLISTNAAANGYVQAGYSGVGVITVSNNSTWVGNGLKIGYNAGGQGYLTLAGGSYTLSGAMLVGVGTPSTGVVTMSAGQLSTLGANVQVGQDGGSGTMTLSGGTWMGYGVKVGLKNSSGGVGSFTLSGATCVFTNTFDVGNGAGASGTVVMTDGLLVTTNSAGTMQCNFGYGSMTVSGGTWLGNTVVVPPSSILQGRLNIAGGTNVFTGSGQTIAIGGGAGATGAVVMTGGLLVATNGGLYINKPGAFASISNGTVLVTYLEGGYASSNTTMTIAGGQVFASSWAELGYNVASSSNNTLLVTGGILDTPKLIIYAASVGNVISNAGGCYQFNTPTPTITPNVGSIVVNGGTLSFRDVTTVDVKGNWSGTQLTNLTFTSGGLNAFRLNNATNATSGQDYIFASTRGATNYTRLQLINGNTCYRGGNVTADTGGTILLSNTTAVLQGSLLVTNGAALTLVNSSLSITGACTLAENAVMSLTTNTAAALVAVTGTLTLPVNATLTLNTAIARDTQVTIFSAGSLVGSPANWTVTPATHRIQKVGTSLVLAPRAPGFIFKVQ